MVRRLPMLLLAVGGIIFALVRWKVHPRPSLITVIALVVFVINVFAYSLVLYFVPDLLRPMFRSAAMMGWVYFIINFADSVILAIVILLLTFAAFTQRSAPDVSNA